MYSWLERSKRRFASHGSACLASVARGRHARIEIDRPYHGWMHDGWTEAQVKEQGHLDVVVEIGGCRWRSPAHVNVGHTRHHGHDARKRLDHPEWIAKGARDLADLLQAQRVHR